MVTQDGLGLEQSDETMEDSFSAMKPKLTASFCFGRTIEEMYAKKTTDNMVVIPNGVEAKIGAKFSSLLFQALAQAAPQDGSIGAPEIGILKGIAKIKTRQEILYQEPKELQDAFGPIPTLANQLKMVQQQVKQAPTELTKHLPGLHELCDGVKRFQVTGLPMKYELDVTFTNFHPSAVLASMSQAVEQ